MFEVKWTKAAKDQYDALKAKAAARRDARMKSKTKSKKNKSTKDEGLFKQIVKTVDLLKTNPRHPGLNTHEYNSIVNPFNKNDKVFEAYVQNKTPGAYRVFWCYGPGNKELTIIAITPHP